MLESALRTMSILASAVVLVSFGLFAIDETRTASATSAAEVAGQQAAHTTAPTSAQERAREKAHTPVREYIDDADDILLSPFEVTGQYDNHWAARGVPLLLALLFYGFGLSFLARYAHGRSMSVRATARRSGA